MRPQTIGLIVASTVTSVFLAAVGVIALWEYLPPPAPPVPHQGPVAFQFNAPFAPLPDMEVPFEPEVARPFAPGELPKARGAVVSAKEYALSGPHTHGNLAIFLIRGEDTLKDQKIMTLQEGLEQGLAVVHDRGQLFIDNRADVPLFIQAGDIVKGGSQDRTLPFDILLSARTNQMPIAALCVESGRSGPRGNELRASFQTSTEQLPGRKLRLAAYRQSQAEVWNNVQLLQANLARNAGGSVQAPLSQTSLQLSLEHPRVQGTVQNYLADLAPSIEGKHDVIGYAVVINGKIQSADVYASNALFQKLWPKLLKASAVEAFAERQPGAAANVPSAEVVQTFLADAEEGQAFSVQGGHRGVVVRQETGQSLLFETCDPARANLVLHRSFLAK